MYITSFLLGIIGELSITGIYFGTSSKNGNYGVYMLVEFSGEKIMKSFTTYLYWIEVGHI